MNLLKLDEEQRSNLAGYYAIARNVSLVAASFSLIVSLTIIVNVVQLGTHDPIRSPYLEELIARVQKDSGDEQLKETVRAYDLMIRKAHFSSLAFIRFGSYLLLGGVCLFLAGLKVMFELKRSLPQPGKFSEIEDTPGRTAAVQYALAGLVSLLVLAAFVLPRVVMDTPPDFKEIAANAEPPAPVKPFAPVEEMMRNWPSFRGYRGLGIAYVEDAVVEWDGTSGKNILWKTPIPKPGPNSPVVWETLVFCTGADSQAREVYCLDLDSGTILWTANTGMSDAIAMPEVGDDTGLAAPTAVTDGRSVAAIFATGELLIIDFEGKIVANRKLETPDNMYGHSSSLATYKGILLVQYDHEAGAKVLAFDMASGEKLWEQQRDVETSWASPVLIPAEGEDQLVLNAYPFVTGYDPLTGQAQWQVEGAIDGQIGPSPAFNDGRLYLANLHSVLSCVDIASRKILWQYEDNLPDASSPVATGEYLILPSSYEKVSCFDAKTGELHWEHRFEDGFYSSPIVAGGNVYMTDKTGITRIFALDSTFAAVADSPLGEPCTATPAFVGGSILIRGEKHLYRIGTTE